MAAADAQRDRDSPRVEVDPPRHWERRKRDIASIVWVSFLTAAGATVVFFAFIDPLTLADMTGWDISRETGYAIGFFMFWLLTAGTSVLSFYMARTDHRARDVPGLEKRLRRRGGPGESSR